MTAVSTAEHVRQLQVELNTVKRSLAAARRKLRETGRHADRIQQAHTDALLLAAQHVAYLDTSRRQALELAQITQRRWEGAIGLLKLARLHNGRRWLCHDLQVITNKLEMAKQKALDMPVAYHARLCNHAIQKRH